MVNGKLMEFENYGVDNETGAIWSFANKTPRKLKGSPRNSLDKDNSYLFVGIYDNQFSKNKAGARTKSFYIQCLVAHTLFEIPIPPGVTEAEWKRTPKSVRTACLQIYHVNHRDHNKWNNNPKNLEYTLATENAQAAIKHYKELTGNEHFNYADLGKRGITANAKTNKVDRKWKNGKLVEGEVKESKVAKVRNLNKWFMR